MKLFYRLAGLTFLLGLLFACTSPPPEGGADSGQIVEADQPRTVELDEAEEEEIEEAPEESVEEEITAVTAVDGPTHVAAATVEEALVEREYDQVKGADEPLMTIIEYGDFQ